MGRSLTADDARQSLNAHVAAKGREIFEKFGPDPGWATLQRILADRSCVRYPCEIVFDAAPLQPLEFAHPVPKGDSPSHGFRLHVHPYYLTRLDALATLVYYQLVVVNYGEMASVEDAETFGAEALGITRDEYYRRVCALADEISGVIS